MSKKQETDIPIEKALSKTLKRAYNIMHVTSNKIFKNSKITVAQFDMMETILLSPEKGLSIQDISKKTVSLQPNTTRMVADLENAGLVERSSGEDRRTVIVKVTPKGKSIVTDIQKPLMQSHFDQYQNLNEEEKHQLNELLEKIC